MRTWPDFWNTFLTWLTASDVTSLSSNKFDDLAAWLASEWDLPPGSVACKYVQHPKNRWNRLREAVRLNPAAIVLLFEGDHVGAIEPRVQEAVDACPNVGLILVLLRPPGMTWQVASIFRRGRSTPPIENLLASAPVSSVALEAAETSYGVMPVGETTVRPEEVAEALQALAFAAVEGASPGRAQAAATLAQLTGVPTDSIAFKAIPSTKNLGNRLGEALARAPSILVVICPEMLEDRVLEEKERWSEASMCPLLLVLCGEATRLTLVGPNTALAARLRWALERGDAEPTNVSETPRAAWPAAWAQWTYEDWNRHLIQHCFTSDLGVLDPVERLPATPDELALMVNAPPEHADDVVSAFVTSCLSRLPAGVSFCGFCSNRRVQSSEGVTSWAPDSAEPPPFFAMLWLTCLVAYGYPSSQGGFHDRLDRLVGKATPVHCLPMHWILLALWTSKEVGRKRDCRELKLPPEDNFRSIIGFSHFLAFPHRDDRRLIARILVEADLVGFEPPILPVIQRLEAERARFSPLFRQDLDEFTARFLQAHQNPEDSAFWRAVRQEALRPSHSADGRRSEARLTSILGVFDDQGFLPLLGCHRSWSPPPGYVLEPLDGPIGGFEFFATSHVSGVEGVAHALFESLALLGSGPRNLLNQGILIFQEDQSGEFFLASGHDIAGADVALVREALVSAFLGAFGGTAEESRVRGWMEVTGCRIRPLEALPPGLQGALQLLPTMSPPSVRLVGGIRISGGYLAFEGFLPRVRAIGASSVSLSADHGTVALRRDGPDEWTIPYEFLNDQAQLNGFVEVDWPGGDGSHARKSRKALSLRSLTMAGGNYRLLVGGSYFIEACRPGEASVVSGEEIPLGVTTPERGKTADLLAFERSARYLGPGHGQMSLDPGAGFDWLAVGSKGHPAFLVFVGNPHEPQQPVQARSSLPGDRRHWTRAFSRASEAWVRGAGGEYEPVERYQLVAASREAHARHRPDAAAPTVAETGLGTLALRPPSRTAPALKSALLGDALAALSANRGGLAYQTVRELFEELTGSGDRGLHHELIRAWVECGALDLARHQSYGAARIVARRPRFVFVQFGPFVEATLAGLITTAIKEHILRLAASRRLQTEQLEAGSPWQPSLIRIRAPEALLREISYQCDLAEPEWLGWRHDGVVPPQLQAAVDLQGLRSDTPPQGFEVALRWSWADRAFLRGAAPDDVVTLDQRVHPTSGSIYVVSVDGQSRLWTYIRNWALLYAHELKPQRPFVLDPNGWITTQGASPVHLPLPLGRLCAFLGEGLPGPTVSDLGKGVRGYCYPFGRRVAHVVAQVVPPSWINHLEG